VPTPVGSPPACQPPNGAFGILHRFNHHLGPALWGSALQVKFTFIVFNERTPPPLDRISNKIMKGIVWYGCDIFVCNAPRMNAMIYYLSQCYQNTNNFFIKKRFFNCSSEPKYEMQISNTLQLIFRFKQYKSQCLFKHLKKIKNKKNNKSSRSLILIRNGL